MPANVVDTLGRPLHDLRISVTDRCNFRCTYCMPKEIFGADYAFLPRAEVLTFEEIERRRPRLRRARRREAPADRRRAARPARPAGPRRDAGRDPPARRPPLDLTLTTNGSALRRLAGPLADAGLQRVTVSLDSLDDAVFGAMNGVDFPGRQGPRRDRRGEGGRSRAGQDQHGRPPRDQRVERPADGPLGRRDEGLILRFIEYMDVGHTNGWRMDDVVPADELVATIDAEMPLEPVPPRYRGEVATRWRYRDGAARSG